VGLQEGLALVRLAPLVFHDFDRSVVASIIESFRA
jgi:hypothetical protein